MKQAVLKDGETVLWEASREDKNADLELAGEAPEDKEIDSSKLSAVKNAFSWIRFSDIADPASAPESTGFDKAKVLQVTDFDGFVYDIVIAAPVNGKQHLKYRSTGREPSSASRSLTRSPRTRIGGRRICRKVRENQDKARELNARLSP